jgi:hypothetical protein
MQLARLSKSQWNPGLWPSTAAARQSLAHLYFSTRPASCSSSRVCAHYRTGFVIPAFPENRCSFPTDRRLQVHIWTFAAPRRNRIRRHPCFILSPIHPTPLPSSPSPTSPHCDAYPIATPLRPPSIPSPMLDYCRLLLPSPRAPPPGLPVPLLFDLTNPRKQVPAAAAAAAVAAAAAAAAQQQPPQPPQPPQQQHQQHQHQHQPHGSRTVAASADAARRLGRCPVWRPSP